MNTPDDSWAQLDGRDISGIVAVRDRFEIPVGLAHNDLQRNYQGMEAKIARILSDNNIFLELCQSRRRNIREGLNYYRHFSPELIEALRGNGVKVAVGTDFHRGREIDDFEDAYSFAGENDLEFIDIVY